MLQSSQPAHRMILRYHPQIGHLFVPSLVARVPHEDGGYFVRTNAQGFRSDLEFDRPRRGRPRILVFGDSFTAGDGVSNHERFAELAGEALGAEVYNFGVSGTGTDQQLLIHEHFGRGIDADLVVLCVCVENIERIKVRYRESIDRVTGERILVPKPYFELAGDELSLHHAPVPRERPDRFAVERGLYQSGAPARLQWLYRRYHEFMQVPGREALRDRMRRIYKQASETRARFRAEEVYRDYERADSVGWRLMAAIVRKFAAEVAPLPLLVVPIPTRPVLTRGHTPRYIERFASLADPRAGLHVADVTSPLIQRPEAERRALTFPVDPHPSRRGHQELARQLARAIESRSLLPVRSADARREAEHATSLQSRAHVAGRATTVLGLSAFYHDSAACLVRDGRIVAAAQEERFSRVKNDRRYPRHSVNFCLEAGEIQPSDLTAVAFYDNTFQTFERILHTQLAVGEAGREAWLRTMPSWVRFKLHLPQLIRRSLHYDGPLFQDSHHRSHVASAYLPSPFDRAAVLTIDGVGEWATASVGQGEGGKIALLHEMQFPHSLGLLYSAFTQFTGFKVNSGEYKMMGLAPYGKPIYRDVILQHLVDLKEDGSLELNLERFGFLSEPRMTNAAFAELFDGPARDPDAPISRREMHIAASIQAVTEEAVLRMARYAQRETGETKLCLSGGVALNCVANGKLLREGPFEDVWIQPAAGDAGSALGAALDVTHNHLGLPREAARGRSSQGGSYLGPKYSQTEIESYLDTYGFPYRVLAPEERALVIAELLDAGKVVGHFSGGLEFGPRALGARSILGDARNTEMQVNLNLKIKYRESFRPFAPSVLLERVSDVFEHDGPSPYMLIVAPVREDRRLPFEMPDSDDMLPVVRMPRSDLPAITHVDYSARIQTVAREDHPAYYDLIRAFGERTGTPVIVNTSFNVRGEPIVCTPSDAYRCFMRTEMDVLVLENCLLRKEEQPAWPEPKGHIEEHDRMPQIERGDPLVDALEKVFENSFLPVARRLAARHAGRVPVTWKRSGSTWDRHGEADLHAVFEIPSAIDRPDFDPDEMSRAVARFWEPGEARDALTPVLRELLELSEAHGSTEDLEEEVSDMIYVMF